MGLQRLHDGGLGARGVHFGTPQGAGLRQAFGAAPEVDHALQLHLPEFLHIRRAQQAQEARTESFLRHLTRPPPWPR